MKYRSESRLARFLLLVGAAGQFVVDEDISAEGCEFKWRAVAVTFMPALFGLFGFRGPLIQMDVYPVCPHDGSLLVFHREGCPEVA